MDQSMRGFIAEIEKSSPEEIIRVEPEVDPEYQVTALIMEYEKRQRWPILIFDKIKGHDLPLITNILSTRKRFAAAMGAPEQKLNDTYESRVKNYIPPIEVSEGGFKDVIMEGDELDLARLPIIKHFSCDGSAYITAGLAVAKDPASGIYTCGYHRMMLKGKDKMGISLHSRRRMYEYHRRAEEMGKPLEIAVAIGVHPLVSLGALAFLPYQVGQFDAIGGLFGEPLKIARCHSLDLCAPASSEIVIEGEILNTVREDEGPFGEFTGYASRRSTRHVFRAKSILMRRDAIYQDICPGFSAEHDISLGIPREIEIKNALLRSIPNVKAVHVPLSGCGSFSAYISIKKTIEGQAKQAIFTTFGVDHYLKMVVVVDEDIDVYNETDVLWALLTRTKFDKGVIIVPDSMGTVLDPVANDKGLTSKIGIDTTKPLGEDFAERLAIEPEAEQWAREIVSRLEKRTSL